MKSSSKRKRKNLEHLSIKRIVELQEKYCSEHKIFLTYGQFVEKLKSGEIKIEE